MQWNKIPKIIHYCWFGWKPKPQKVLDCIASWKKYCPEYQIWEWNEQNFDLKNHSYAQKFYKKKKWAFVSDYVRMYALYHEGWIYVDTDIEILKNFDSLRENEFFTGFQDIFSLWCSCMWAKKNNEIVKEFLEYYQYKNTRIILPNLVNTIFKGHWVTKYTWEIIQWDNYTLYPKEYFYPYAYFEPQWDMCITKNTYTIHYFDASWLPYWIPKFIFPLIGWYADFKKNI